uniref:Uncharacterized protein n=1 Tax=Leersia perrieri TaxID=77586 RepID=A0A0D9VVW2_9ORYZ
MAAASGRIGAVLLRSCSPHRLPRTSPLAAPASISVVAGYLCVPGPGRPNLVVAATGQLGGSGNERRQQCGNIGRGVSCVFREPMFLSTEVMTIII